MNLIHNAPGKTASYWCTLGIQNYGLTDMENKMVMASGLVSNSPDGFVSNGLASLEEDAEELQQRQ